MLFDYPADLIVTQLPWQHKAGGKLLAKEPVDPSKQSNVEISENREKEIWRRRGIPESSKQGEEGLKKIQGWRKMTLSELLVHHTRSQGSAVSRDGEDDEVDRNDRMTAGRRRKSNWVTWQLTVTRKRMTCHDESSNSTHGLDSIVQDSLSPLQEKSLESGDPACLYVDPPMLLVKLNPSAVRKSIRSQQYGDSLSKYGIDEVFGYIFDSQEQEQNMIDKELQNTIMVGLSILYTQKEAMVVDMVDDQNQDFWKFQFRRVLYDWEREQLQNLVQLLSGIALQH
ncbi:hypothetical protein RHSIM_Rhsim07G0053500 [Rhododendron simsii]|uniref:Uncharacterized protein n=1 Tax=Rhododendron simsii TaxID=118357 RepID=A0A834LJ93_RHOSS|nr:hypothetical protein RHSIM_Rhsim07G0053500 [Rhododendron simsii]